MTFKFLATLLGWLARLFQPRVLAFGLAAACAALWACSAQPPPSASDRAAASPEAGIELPDFPWPPPTPSARLVLDRTLFAAAPSQFAVGERLTRALNDAGYSEHSFYRAPGGFALVARLERMRDDGASAAEELRFLQPGAAEPFSLSVYIQRLFFAPEGFYRQIVFVTTDKPFTTDASDTLTADEAADLLRRGADRLPDAYRRFPFSASHNVTALIYEFRKGPQDRDVATLDPGRLGARTHLERAGILPALERAK